LALDENSLKTRNPTAAMIYGDEKLCEKFHEVG